MFLKWLHGFLFSLKFNSLWTAYLPVYLHWHTSRNVEVEMEHKYQFYVRTSVIRPAAYMEKSWPGAPGHPPPPSQLYRASIRKKPEPGYDELHFLSDWNISVRMLWVARLGPARRVDSLETVYMRKSWLAPQGPPILPTEWPYPQGHPIPRAGFAVSHVNGQRLFISNCRKTWLGPVGPWIPGSTFLHINRALGLGETSNFS